MDRLLELDELPSSVVDFWGKNKVRNTLQDVGLYVYLNITDVAGDHCMQCGLLRLFAIRTK